jgi:RNA binding exosome subunit
MLNMKEYKIYSISLSTIVHATEDKEKVKSAIFNIIPRNLVNLFTINEINVKGHYGNPITLLSLEVNNPDITNEIFEFIIKSIPKEELALIKNNPSLYCDDRSIFLRIDKQYAYLGIIKLSFLDDVIKIKINVLNPLALLSKL